MKAEELKKQLEYENKTVWEEIDSTERDKAFEFSNGYKSFLDSSKTERLFVENAVKAAELKGFKPLKKYIESGSLPQGSKVYIVNRDKSILLAVAGKEPVINGVNVIGAHVDAPRLDLKPTPLYEETGMAMLKTHYYGGIKKYQWVSIPLALYGTIIKKDGARLQISIGDNENDPVLTITDLLPHLAQEQVQKKANEFITGEGLNVLFGTIPYSDEDIKNNVKLNILNILNQKYGITEAGLVTAELQIVPAFKAKDVALDRSLVGSYGQDDRVCSYTALQALFDLEVPQRTAVCYLVDKEEIGSVGNTAAQGPFLLNSIAELIALQDANYSDLLLRRCVSGSKCISADVNAAVDPNYDGVQDKKNASYLGKGLILQKYVGSRGKYGTNDALPEFMHSVISALENNKVSWQLGEMGKIDLGGGGTISEYMSNLGFESLDCGIPVLSMHSPFEVTSKMDIYMAYKGYKALYNL